MRLSDRQHYTEFIAVKLEDMFHLRFVNGVKKKM